MAITRIKNNQITDNTIDANAKVSDFSITSNKLANNLTYGSDFTVSGNLTVSGQTTTIDTVSTVIEDPTLLLAKDQTGAPSVDIGIIGERGDELNVAMIWDESADKFVAVYTTDAVTNTTVSIDSYASFQAHDITANANLAVTGTSNLVGNITLGNVFIDGQKTVDMGNSIIGNVQDPVANSDVATKFYVDSQSASGFTIEDDQSNTTIVSGGDTLELFGTTDEVTVTVTGDDQITFGLPANVTVADVLTVGGELFANGNIIPSTANIFTLGNASHRWANLFLTGSTMVIGNVQIEQTGVDNFDQPVLSIQNQAGNNNAAISVAGISVADYITAIGNVTGSNITTAGDVTTATVTASGNVAGGNLTTAGDVTTATVTASGNVAGGNLTTAGDVTTATVTASGNIDGANLNATSGITAGTTVTATGNITGGNIITAGIVVATGNITGGNLTTAGDVTTATVTASGNVSADNVLTDTVESSGTLNLTAVSGDILFSATGNIDAGNVNILNVASPVADSDAATKSYVDSVAQGLDVKPSVLVSTVGNLDVATGGVVSYNNGTDGVGATLTTTGTFTTIDGVSIATTGTRVLVKDEATAAHNGIYVYTNSTTLTRATDFDASNEIPSAFTFVEQGSTYADTGWVCTTNAPVTVGTTNIDFTQFSGAGQYTAGDGLDLTGTVFSVNVDGTTIAIVADTLEIPEGASLPNVDIGDGTASTLDVTGNIIAGNIEANSAITAGTTVTATGNVSGGNIITAGDVTTATVTASSTIIATGNITGSNLTTAGVVSATGNITGGNLTTAGDVTTATVTASGNVAGGNITTAGVVAATGNVAGGNITTAGVVEATGNVAGGNLTTAGVVEATGNVVGGNITTAGVVEATGNVVGGNIITAGAVDATGNVSGGNLIAAGDVSGATLTISGNIDGANLNATSGITAGTTVTATGNITGGNLTTAGDVTTATVTASGNVVGGNLTTAGDVTTVTVTASGNVSADNVLTDTVESATSITITAVSGDILFSATGNIDAGNVNILNVASPVADSDAATKGYVDSVAQGLDVKASVLTATTGNLNAATGGVVSYNNGSSGVGATLTTTGTFTTIDDVSIATTGARVLVKDEATAAHNGIYVYTNSTTLTRATDFDASNEIPSAFTFVEQGTSYADTGWVCTTNAPVTVGTTNIGFTQFSGAGQYTAGDGLDLTGTVFSVNVDGTTIAIAADTLGIPEGASLPNVDIGDGTASSLDVTGNIVAGNIEANSAITAGTTVTATGNVSGGNIITAGVVEATGNVSGSNIITAGVVEATGNITGGNLTTAGDVTTATVTASGNVAGGNITTAGDVTTATVTASGNVAGGNITTAGDVTTATVTASGNVAGGNITTAGDVTTATVTASGNVAGGNLTTAGDVTTATVTASGNVAGGNITTAGDVTTATVTASGNVAGGNITTAGDVTTATVTASGNISGANLDVTSGITAGTTVTATGNITGGNLTTAGDVTTVTVTASGNIVGGNISTAGIVVATGNITGGNLTTAGDVTTATVTASGNVSADNVLTDTVESSGTLNLTAVSGDILFSATGNIDAGNVNILNVAEPVLDSDAATKGYVDSVAQGLDVKASVRLATASALPAFTYDNGTSGVGATITANANGALSVDGTTPSTGDRILIKNETTTNTPYNGIYVVTTVGDGSTSFVLTRATDFDSGSPSGEVPGAFTFVEEGATNADAGFVCTTDAPVTIGTTNITFSQFSGAGSIVAGDGLSKSGNELSVNVDGTTIAIAADTLGIPEGANLPNVDIGDGTASSLDVTGNIIAGNIEANSAITTTTLTASGNVAGGNITTAGDVTTATVTASGNVTGGNLTTAGDVTTATVTASGNVAGGNITTAGVVEATGNVIGGNITTAGNVTGSNITTGGSVIGSQIITGGTVTATGNITGGNVISLGSFVTLGNIVANNAVITNSIDTDTLTATGNVLGSNVIATGIIEASGNVIGGNIVTTGTVSGVSAFFTGNIDGANLNATDSISATSITATGNIEGGNITTAGVVEATGNVVGGNITTAGVVEATGNVAGGNITTAGDVTTVTMTASGNISALGTSTLGNIIISGADITTDTGEITINDAAADINLRIKGENNNELFFVDAAANVVNIGNAAAVTGASFRVGTTDSILIPVGNTAQRPGTPATGMIRFNSQINTLEFYDNDSWEAAGTTFTVIASETFNGDGSTTVFILSANHTTASCIVSINGVIQLPTTAYSVSNDTLTFTEAPLAGDVIEVRTLTTTTSIDKLANGAETAVLEASAGSADMFITGNLIPTGNVLQDLGSTANRFRDLYLSGSSITLGGVVLKDAGSSTFAVYELDGTTLATIDASINTTGNVSVGNLTVNTATSTNTLTASGNVDAGNLITTGVVTATGNITGGNLVIASSITTTTVSATGNVSGGNLTTVGTVSATGNVSGGNLVTSGNIVAGNLIVSGIEAVTTLNVSGDTTIVGNLTVSGTTITANVATLTVTDPILALGRGANGDPLTSNDGLDRGLELYYFTSSEQHAFIGYDNDAGKIISAANASIANNLVTVNSYGTTVVGTLEVGNIVNSNANGVGNIGSSTTFFNTVFAKATSAEYADLAEHYQSDDDYEPGTVVMFGGAQEITLCSIDGCQRVAGVISTNPSYVMNAGLTGEHTVVVALTGRVPTKVTGKVRKGDMMVSNGDGTARAEADPKIGSVIGKALADFDGETGVIEVVVGRL